jgi:filamentous hemagglutinin
MLAQGIHCGVDCSEIAENLYNAAGKTGEILRVEPAEPGLNLTVTEGGQQVNYMYHEVYTDGNYVFDPRLGPDPIPIQGCETTILGDNPDATIQTVNP